MEVKVKLQSITIKDENSGDAYTVTTIRSAKEISEYIQETEKDEIVNKLEQEVCDVLKEK